MNKFSDKISLPNIAIASVIAIFFIADRWLKIIALNLRHSVPIKLIGDIFTFSFVPNYYMAFSLPVGGLILNLAVLLVITALAIFIFYLINKNPARRLDIIFLTIILIGAISNIFDRLAYGFVIDYLSLKYFTIFNLADVMISGGALILIAANLKNR